MEQFIINKDDNLQTTGKNLNKVLLETNLNKVGLYIDKEQSLLSGIIYIYKKGSNDLPLVCSSSYCNGIERGIEIALNRQL